MQPEQEEAVKYTIYYFKKAKQEDSKIAPKFL